MGDDGVIDVDDDLEPDDRAELAKQLRRLNSNIERQFEIIDQQRTLEAKRARRRWYVVLAVVALIAGGNVRVEMVRQQQDRRQCLASNQARREIRESFDLTLRKVERLADGQTRQAAHELRLDVASRLGAALAEQDCPQPRWWTWLPWTTWPARAGALRSTSAAVVGERPPGPVLLGNTVRHGKGAGLRAGPRRVRGVAPGPGAAAAGHPGRERLGRLAPARHDPVRPQPTGPASRATR